MHTLASGQAADGQILGHEFSGRIARLGQDVTGWREGQPVAASPLGSCGKCRICARGLAFRCPAAPNIGITRPGAYAQYVAVPARQLVALPPELPVEMGAHAEPLSVAMQAVSQARVGPGDPVLVYGVGPIGLYAIMALRLAGAGPIVAAGRSGGRRAAAADVGADVVLDTRSQPVTSWAEESGTFSAYIASKHAVLGLTKSAALEGAAYGIRVNCVAPGHIDTRMGRDLTKQINPDDPEGVYREVSASVPLHGRYGTATEVANLVVFLLSDEAEYVSGSLHLIDGALNAG